MVSFTPVAPMLAKRGIKHRLLATPGYLDLDCPVWILSSSMSSKTHIDNVVWSQEAAVPADCSAAAAEEAIGTR